MFKADLTSKMKQIFGINRVSFDRPGESMEQEMIWIEVDSSMNRISPPRQTAWVKGKIRIFGNSDKLPYGFLSKRINAANPDLTRDIFFYDFEENAETFRNIVERSMSFHYLYEGQYDPAIGEISEVNLSIAEG